MAMSENPRPEPNRSPAEGWLPERLLDTADLDRGDQALAALLELATAPGTSDELASGPAVLAAYQATLTPAGTTTVAEAVPSLTVTPTVAGRTPRGTSWVHRLAARSTAAAVAIVAMLSFGGVATAAYTGALPAPLQDFAHRHLGAPAVGHGIWAHHTNPHAASKPPSFVHGHPRGSHGRPDTPEKSRAALTGLCKAVAEGHLRPTSTAYQRLVDAAGGADQVATYCADKPGPGKPLRRPTPSTRSRASAVVGSPSPRPKTTSPGLTN